MQRAEPRPLSICLQGISPLLAPLLRSLDSRRGAERNTARAPLRRAASDHDLPSAKSQQGAAGEDWEEGQGGIGEMTPLDLARWLVEALQRSSLTVSRSTTTQAVHVYY